MERDKIDTNGACIILEELVAKHKKMAYFCKFSKNHIGEFDNNKAVEALEMALEALKEKRG